MRVCVLHSLIVASLLSTAAFADDCSATLPIANQPVTLLSNVANNGPQYVLLQNIDRHGPLWFSVVGPAKAGAPGSFILAPSSAGGFASSSLILLSFSAKPSADDQLSVVGSHAGHLVSCTYW